MIENDIDLPENTGERRELEADSTRKQREERQWNASDHRKQRGERQGIQMNIE